MTEKEKMLAGLLYDANYNPALMEERHAAKDLCLTYNALHYAQEDEKQKILHRLLGTCPQNILIEPPFFCDYGYNIHLGENFYANHNLVILDGAPVTCGDFVFIAPNCCFSTAGHPLDVARRNAGLEFAKPIHIGNNVWIGAGVQLLPGVSIGDNSVIGAGSVVNRDIPDGVVAVGAPCRVLRKIDE